MNEDCHSAKGNKPGAGSTSDYQTPETPEEKANKERSRTIDEIAKPKYNAGPDMTDSKNRIKRLIKTDIESAEEFKSDVDILYLRGEISVELYNTIMGNSDTHLAKLEECEKALA